MSKAICMVTTSYPKRPGDTTAPFIASMAEHVAQRGHRVDVVLPSHRDLVGGQRAGVQLHPYAYTPVPAWRRWGYAEAMAADVRLRGTAYLAAPSALAATTMRTAVVAARSGSCLIQAHWVIPNGPPAALAAALLGRPLVVSLHGSDVHVAERSSLARRLAGWVFGRAAAVTACSPDLAARAVNLGAPRTRTHVVPYGVDVAQFRPDPAARARLRQQLGIGEATLLILGLGRMVYKKGFRFAIEALARSANHDAVLVLAGDGDIRRELTCLAEQSGMGHRVIFPGAAARQDVPAWFAACDIFVLPSVHDEAGNVDGLPNVLLEALASGCAVVASDLAGVRLVLNDGEQGLLVPEGDALALGEAFNRLSSDRGLRQRLGAQARARVISELTWQHCAAQLDMVYQQAMAGPIAGGRGRPA